MYDLNRKEYYEYQGKFVKTFVGMKLLIESILLAVAFVVCLVEFAITPTFGPVSCILLVGGIVCGVGAFMYDTFYMRELHMFIREQLKENATKKKEK